MNREELLYRLERIEDYVLDIERIGGHVHIGAINELKRLRADISQELLHIKLTPNGKKPR